MTGDAPIALAAETAIPSTKTNSTFGRAAGQRSSAFASNAATSFGNHAVQRMVGTNSIVAKSLVHTPYQPTTSEGARTERMTASSHVYTSNATPIAMNGRLPRANDRMLALFTRRLI